MSITRRAFMTMLGAATALLGLTPKPSVAEPAKPADKKPVIWIGHF